MRVLSSAFHSTNKRTLFSSPKQGFIRICFISTYKTMKITSIDSQSKCRFFFSVHIIKVISIFNQQFNNIFGTCIKNLPIYIFNRLINVHIEITFGGGQNKRRVLFIVCSHEIGTNFNKQFNSFMKIWNWVVWITKQKKKKLPILSNSTRSNSFNIEIHLENLPLLIANINGVLPFSSASSRSAPFIINCSMSLSFPK